MANASYIGSGTTLSSKYYVRNFYISNRDAGTSSKRKNIGNTALTLADGAALRRAIKNLGSSDFSDSQDSNIRNSVLAYIQTYNNTLSSAAGSPDHTLERNSRQLKSLAKEYSGELDKIGITVNEDGTLTSRESLFKSADLSKFKSLFSGDSDFMQRCSAYAKRIERRIQSLKLAEETPKLKGIADSKTSGTASIGTDTSTAAAQLVAESLDLDTLVNTSVGRNINIVL